MYTPKSFKDSKEFDDYKRRFTNRRKVSFIKSRIAIVADIAFLYIGLPLLILLSVAIMIGMPFLVGNSINSLAFAAVIAWLSAVPITICILSTVMSICTKSITPLHSITANYLERKINKEANKDWNESKKLWNESNRKNDKQFTEVKVIEIKDKNDKSINNIAKAADVALFMSFVMLPIAALLVVSALSFSVVLSSSQAFYSLLICGVACIAFESFISVIFVSLFINKATPAVLAAKAMNKWDYNDDKPIDIEDILEGMSYDRDLIILKKINNNNADENTPLGQEDLVGKKISSENLSANQQYHNEKQTEKEQNQV